MFLDSRERLWLECESLRDKNLILHSPRIQSLAVCATFMALLKTPMETPGNQLEPKRTCVYQTNRDPRRDYEYSINVWLHFRSVDKVVTLPLWTDYVVQNHSMLFALIFKDRERRYLCQCISKFCYQQSKHKSRKYTNLENTQIHKSRKYTNSLHNFELRLM